MNFLVDAHLPPARCGRLRAAGQDARHTGELAERNRTSDGVLNELSVRERRVVITKDADFYHSYLFHGEPWKLLLIRTGNLRRATCSGFLPRISRPSWRRWSGIPSSS